ncbi:hypothetical protein Pse7367_1384 [Thalassoporum mexicanum PCC 7367]|nr:hypothetical protein Pse7367_1384 [Pseudanabaena sp. PCC 7367]
MLMVDQDFDPLESGRSLTALRIYEQRLPYIRQGRRTLTPHRKTLILRSRGN